MCSAALVIERTVALVYSSTYEMCGKTFGILLVIFIQFGFTFAFLSKLYFNATFVPDPTVTLYYCQTLASGHGSVWSINAQLYVVMVGQVVCRIIFAVLAKQTKVSKDPHDLVTIVIGLALNNKPADASFSGSTYI